MSKRKGQYDRIMTVDTKNIKVNIRKLEAELWKSSDHLRQCGKLTSRQYWLNILHYAYGRY